MNIPGYDAWKLQTPDDAYEARGGTLCQFCGAYSVSQCELREEMGGACAWEDADEEPDPDYLRDLRNE